MIWRPICFSRLWVKALRKLARSRLALSRLALAITLCGLHTVAMAQGPKTADMPKDYQRIVSLGGSITEILYALDMQDRIAAVDVTSVYPPQALRDKPNVGYIRGLNAEGVLGVAPDIILAEHDAGPPEVVETLQSTAVPFTIFEAAYSGDGVVQKIKAVGAAIGQEEQADRLAQRMQAQLTTVSAAIATLPEASRKSVLFILTMQDGRLMVAGRNNAADAIIKMAGGTNLMQAFEGYKLVDDEALLVNPPDAIVMMQRSAHALDKEALARHPALQDAPAIKTDQIIVMPGMYLLGFGPRTAHATADLARALYPDLPALSSLPGWQPEGEAALANPDQTKAAGKSGS